MQIELHQTSDDSRVKPLIAGQKALHQPIELRPGIAVFEFVQHQAKVERIREQGITGQIGALRPPYSGVTPKAPFTKCLNATKLLSDAQMPYSIVFTGADHASRKAAVAAGLGLMLMMGRAMTPDVVIANEAFLPPAPIIKTGIYAREGLNVRRIMPLVQTLEGLLRPPPVPELVTVQAKQPAPERPARRRRG